MPRTTLANIGPLFRSTPSHNSRTCWLIYFPSQVYSLAQFYNMLQNMLAYVYPNAVSASVECLVSVKRIQEFLLLEEKCMPALMGNVSNVKGIDNKCKQAIDTVFVSLGSLFVCYFRSMFCFTITLFSTYCNISTSPT